MPARFEIYKTLFAYKAWSNAEAFSVLDKSINALDHDKRQASLRILNHVYVVDRIFQANLQSLPHGFTALNTPEIPSLKDLRENVVQLDQWYIAYVASLKESQIAESISFTFVDGSPGLMTRAEMLQHIIAHGSGHRGAVGQLLSNAGIQRPRDGLTVFLHSPKVEEYLLSPNSQVLLPDKKEVSVGAR